MRVALVYDRINTWGGAERVLLALQKLFPEAPLYTSVYHRQNASWAKKFAIKTSFLQKIPQASSHHQLLPLLMPLAFEHFSFDSYDLVISVTSEAAKGIITRPQTKHICYCLTPTRYLWSGYDTYFPNNAMKLLSQQAISSLKKWDRIAAQRPDLMIAISKEVQARIKKYYGRESALIYPPVTLRSAIVKEKQSNNSISLKNSYFLIVSRLSKFTKYKRIDIAIEACTMLNLPLKVIGSGSWKNELQAKAGPTVEFLGSVNDLSLKSYYENCKALIFPGVEDFGLTVVEAQQFGKPVIAFRGGGAMETIKEGKTGLFFEKQTKTAMIQALRSFDTFRFNAEDCKRQAEQFTFAQFKGQFVSLVQNVI